MIIVDFDFASDMARIEQYTRCASSCQHSAQAGNTERSVTYMRDSGKGWSMEVNLCKGLGASGL